MKSYKNSRYHRGDSQSLQKTHPLSGKKYTVTKNTELLPFLLEVLSGQSSTSVKNLLKHRCIAVNNNLTTQYNLLLKAGDCVTVISAKNNRFGLDHPKLQILYEDDSLLVVNKASGLHSVDSTGHGVENAAGILEHYIKRKSPDKRIYIVHRLDRDTSGVMLFAKSREAQNKLVSDWNERVLGRTYIALAEGEFVQQSGTIDSYLYEDERKVVHSTQDSSKGLRAITHYQVLKADSEYTLLKLDLETGRTNQIRVHLQSLGHPIAGDAKYGAKTNPIQRLALHAKTIKFSHPLTAKILSFNVEVPDSFGVFD